MFMLVPEPRQFFFIFHTPQGIRDKHPTLGQALKDVDTEVVSENKYHK
jgi:hypothetical protein